MDFSTTALNVLLLVAMAIPGYILVKTKLVKENGIQYFSALLLYINQSFLCLYSFLKVEYTQDLAKNLGIAFGASLAIQLVVFGIFCLILFKWFDKVDQTASFIEQGYLDPLFKSEDDELTKQIALTKKGRSLRILSLTSAFGNAGFFGIPLLQLLFPSYPQIVIYAAVYVVSMNLILWTLGAYIVTGDKKYISPRKAIINPQTITLCVALPLFFCKVTIGDMPDVLAKIITYLADMTAPLCMIILGMRFAVAPLKDLVLDWKSYISAVIKNLLFPLLVYAILLPFKMEPMLRTALVLLSAMPTATMTLNFAEIYNGDKKTAANSILISTILSIITIPVIMLLL